MEVWGDTVPGPWRTMRCVPLRCVEASPLQDVERRVLPSSVVKDLLRGPHRGRGGVPGLTDAA